MASRTLISVEEYLRTSYRPDCDYVDGEVLERNVGEKSHAKLQKAILLFLSAREKELGIWVIQEQRVQVAPSVFASLTSASPWASQTNKFFTKPPFICIEILSPEDRWPRDPAAHRRLPRHGSTIRVGTGPFDQDGLFGDSRGKNPASYHSASSRLRTLLSKFLLARSCNQIVRSKFRPCRIGLGCP